MAVVDDRLALLLGGLTPGMVALAPLWVYQTYVRMPSTYLCLSLLHSYSTGHRAHAYTQWPGQRAWPLAQRCCRQRLRIRSGALPALAP
jgi:hypothetical protein